ncbi:hypothetical protein N6G02_01110 [Cupriavidus gilardii]|uniref:hypothetical protein n=1 Tax=Cupriavidus gilardii TaxID=82541 RepID=UPI0021BE4317|nr:hypothetical protein [Cupriavidus gilardii]MCT9114719.1 hypothetical protein [Cupriavidus gilardii]
MSALVGEPLDTAIQVLGMPSGEQTIAGRRYIQWGRSSSGFVPISNTTTSYGSFNTAYNFGTYSKTTTGTSYLPVSYNCTVTVAVDSGEHIRQTQYEGNLGGCEPYIKRLNAYRKARGIK